MAKRLITKGINPLLGEEEVVLPVKAKSKNIRATFVVTKEQKEKLDALAYWNRVNLKDIVSKAFEEYLEKQGEIKPIPNGQGSI